MGEVKRGKSSLVNALVAENVASPVGVELSTSATLHLVPPTPGRDPDTVELLFPGEIRPVPRAELADWVTTTGARVTDRSTEVLPTGAVIGARGDRLGGATVVDTPGRAGGLNPGHAQLAMRSAQRACVLVVVCDATTPISPEMDFIRDASATAVPRCGHRDRGL